MQRRPTHVEYMFWGAEHPNTCISRALKVFAWLTFRPKLYFFTMGPKMTPQKLTPEGPPKWSPTPVEIFRPSRAGPRTAAAGLRGPPGRDLGPSRPRPV